MDVDALAEHVARKCGLSLAQAQRVTGALFRAIRQFLLVGDEVKIYRFYSFEIARRPRMRYWDEREQRHRFHPARAEINFTGHPPHDMSDRPYATWIDLKAIIAYEGRLSKQQAQEALTTILEFIKGLPVYNQNLTVRGLGRFIGQHGHEVQFKASRYLTERMEVPPAA